MISIVIPYLERLGVDGSEELRYALRAWDRHAKFDYEVILVGDKPKWFNGICIEMSPIRGFNYARAFDITKKLKVICACKEITDDFIYTYDDIYPVKDLTLSDATKVISTGVFNKRRPKLGGSKKWNRLFMNTVEHLEDLPTIYGYETHLPRPLNKEKLAQLIYDFELEVNPLLFSTLYYNQYVNRPDLILNDKMPFRRWVKAPSKEIVGRQITKHTQYLNTQEGGWKHGVSEYFATYYSDKCRWEL